MSSDPGVLAAVDGDDRADEWAVDSLSVPRLVSPCRSRGGPRGHVCSPEHAAVVLGFRDARVAYELAREAVTLGYAEETREYHRTHGTFTFPEWLKSARGSRADREGRP